MNSNFADVINAVTTGPNHRSSKRIMLSSHIIN